MDVALTLVGAWALAMLGWALWPPKARTFHGPTQERVRWRKGKLRVARKRPPKGDPPPPPRPTSPGDDCRGSPYRLEIAMKRPHMTAHQLAQLLLAGPDAPVLLDGYEGGAVYALPPRIVKAALDAKVFEGSWWGPHEIEEAASDYEHLTEVVYLSRRDA